MNRLKRLVDQVVGKVETELDEYLPVWTGALQAVGVLAVIGFASGVVPSLTVIVPVVLISIVQHYLVEEATYGY